MVSVRETGVGVLKNRALKSAVGGGQLSQPKWTKNWVVGKTNFIGVGGQRV